ncbi:MAG: imidazoleglycerol-phosphate dehydratase [Myxococcales bacterium]|nr:imidazoleglycerol-phosphate dehydratase [Myxococcales bacterium]|tara:strand:+ start:52 stop:660 length:609 start_codon:yes stop_codon:yes gene_type:complete
MSQAESKRTGTIHRETRETNIQITIALDGSGQSQIECPVKFLGHMVDQLARHGGFDIQLDATGDVEVDAHHTVEDIGIALGMAMRDALGELKGIERFGFAQCPLDESLANATVDICGRAHATVNHPRVPDMVGDLPTELFDHFIQSLAQNLQATIHVNVLYGQNGHHMIEASFKSLARALKQAVRRTADPNQVPSTKDVLGS